MNLYSEVKTLNNISSKAFDIYFNLKHTRRYENEKNILIIGENIRDIEREMQRLKNEIKYLTLDKRNRKIILMDNTILYFKTIEECQHLEGYRFQDIYFI